MGGINFNKMTFQQKVQQATQNLNAQGKTAPTTADIVNEMVRMAQAEKADNTQLPEGYRIEHLAQTRAGDANNNTYEVYGTPNIPGDIPQDISKFLDFIMELLPEVNNLPSEIKQELIDVLSEYVDKLENGEPISEEPTYELYGTPVIDDVSEKLLNFLQKLTDMGVPKEVITQIVDMLNENPDNFKGLIGDIVNLLHDAGMSDEQIVEILNALDILATTEMVYGTPDLPTDDPTGNVKKLLDFLKKLSQLSLPQELMTAIINELNNMPNIQDSSFTEILDKITEIINASNLDDAKKAEAMQIISEFLDELNTDVIISICLYGSPDIPAVPTFRELIEKLLPDISKLTDEWKSVLTSIVKNFVQILKGFDVEDPSAINAATTGKSLEGTKKALVASEEEIRTKYPENKYEIVHKMPVMGRSGILIFFKEKEQQ